MKTNREELENLVEKCLAELTSASKEKYDVDKAERTAALFLAAQTQLAFFIEDIELKARHSKANIERVEGLKYFEIKESHIGKKITEATLTNSVAKNDDVVSAKKENCEAEAELKKYNYLMTCLLNGHLFFRGIAKGKNAWNE